MNAETQTGRIADPSRRAFLQYAAVGAAALGVGALDACSSSSTPAPASTASLAPRRGGQLRVGVSGGGPSDSLDANDSVLATDFVRLLQLYDTLTEYDDNAGLRMALAEELTPNANATSWTIRLKQGITFHNGKPLGAEDVLFTFTRILTDHFPGILPIIPLDLKNAKVMDPLTVRIPTHFPFATLPTMVPGILDAIVPVGFVPKNPVGTGPFKVQSFTPGQQSVFVRNPDYWRAEPYLDSVIITDYADETSMLNALESNQVDCITPLSYASVPALRSAGQKVLISDGGSWLPFNMRIDQAPFNEPDVRLAFKLMVNRDEMRSVVFGGNGILGNDIFGYFDPAYDQSIPQREQDIPQAKSLLAKHGLSGLQTTLVTSDFHQGAVALATVFKQQAAAAGVTVNIRQVTPTQLYGPQYGTWTFSQDYFNSVSYLRSAALTTLPGGVWNDTHFTNPQYVSLYHQALATTDDQVRAGIIHEMQMIDWNLGGTIIPFFIPNIDGYQSKVVGPVPAKDGNGLGNFQFRTFWLS